MSICAVTPEGASENPILNGRMVDVVVSEINYYTFDIAYTVVIGILEALGVNPRDRSVFPPRRLLGYLAPEIMAQVTLKEMSQGSKSHSAPSIPKYFNYFPYFH
jgi:hypothetical protein